MPKSQLIHLISSTHWGGTEQYAYDICRHYHEQGWRVTAVTRDAKAVDAHFTRHGIPLVHAPLGGTHDPASILLLAGIFRRLDHDAAVVHTHCYSDTFTALAARRLARRPDIRIISTRHKVHPGSNAPLARLVYSHTDAYIFVSKTAFDAMRQTWNNGKFPIADQHIHILHNSLYPSGAEPMPEPARGPVTAICHGTIVAGKGFETVIDALSTLRDIRLRLRIAGSGDPDYLDSLRQRAIARGVMDLIDWIIPAGDINLLIGESHFGVQASAAREAFALESLRYMACGRPQVCVANGAQSEYLTADATAVFTPPNDATLLGAAMRRLAADPALRARMGAQARAEYLERLDWKHFISRLDNIYDP